MSRAIQPFATLYDGDVLYAVSTMEIEQSGLYSPELGVLASEVMWDAILASVPQQPEIPVVEELTRLSASALESFAGTYRFSDRAELTVLHAEGRLWARATGKVNVFSIGRDEDVELQALSANDFFVPGRYPLTLRFDRSGNLVLNPGRWQQIGARING